MCRISGNKVCCYIPQFHHINFKMHLDNKISLLKESIKNEDVKKVFYPNYDVDRLHSKLEYHKKRLHKLTEAHFQSEEVYFIKTSKKIEDQSQKITFQDIEEVKETVSDVIEIIEDKIKDAAIEVFEKAENIIDGIGSLIKHKGTEPPQDSTTQKIVIYSAKNGPLLPGKVQYDSSTKTDLSKIADTDVHSGYYNSECVLKFWNDILGITWSDVAHYLNPKHPNLSVDATIHYRKNYMNAYFNGKEMVYGDGNKPANKMAKFYFDRFVKYLSIPGHEMGHALVGDRLEYEGQAGALNEHYADLFGACAEMYTLGKSVEDYHWLVGDGLIYYDGKTYPLRSFVAPGTAYNIPPLGKDPQPADFTEVDPNLQDDNGGVHIYSGIPNHVFYLICTHYKDYKEPLLFWYKVLLNLNNSNATFQEFADFQIQTALNDGNIKLAQALKDAWKVVKVPTTVNVAAVA